MPHRLCPQLPPPVQGVTPHSTTARLPLQPLVRPVRPHLLFPPPVRDCVVLDARHGLVVLHFVLGDDEVDALVIWDPTTGERWEIPVLDECERDEWYATVLREPTADGTAFVVVRFVTKYYSCSQGQRWSLRLLIGGILLERADSGPHVQRRSSAHCPCGEHTLLLD